MTHDGGAAHIQMVHTCENTHTPVGMYLHIMHEYRWLCHILVRILSWYTLGRW